MYTIIYNFFFYLKRKQKKKREENKTTSIWLQKIVDYIEWFKSSVGNDSMPSNWSVASHKIILSGLND